MHRFFVKPETILRLRQGPLGDYLDRYADWLFEQGFCRAAGRLHLIQIADFSLWLDNRGMTLNDIQPKTIDSFLEDRRRRVKPHAERSTLCRFLRLVRPEICTQTPPPLSASQVLLQDFRRHFLEERGAALVSYLTLQPVLCQFLSDCFPTGTIDCARLTPHDVIGFVRRHAFRHSPGRAKLLVTALRVFLRYLCQRGIYHERLNVLRASCRHVARIDYPEVPLLQTKFAKCLPNAIRTVPRACGITPYCCCSPGWVSVPMRSCG